MPRLHRPEDPWFCPRCDKRFEATEADLWLTHIKDNHPDLALQIEADEEPVRP